MNIPEMNYWYRFISIAGLFIIFSGKESILSIGLFLLFYGVGVWATQNSFNDRNGREMCEKGRDNIFSFIFKMVSLIILLYELLKLLKILIKF